MRRCCTATSGLASADHLAGLAAECGLKAILIDHQGGTLNDKGKPTHPSLASGKSYGHAGQLCGELAATAHGRSAAHFTALISEPNPFRDWNINDRYTDGTRITRQAVVDHLAAARLVLDLYSQALTDGMLR
jgi:hypothetical protein